MKNYKCFSKEYIGESDRAELTMCDPDGAKVGLHFGQDDAYMAYVVDGQAVIGSHYTLEATFKGGIKIYDDRGLAFEREAETVKVYRAGQMGCIIQLFNERTTRS